jgi:hypothetical protein
MVSDRYTDLWKERGFITTFPSIPNQSQFAVDPEKITRAEFDQLKKEVLELKDWIIRAKQYDIDNNEPECELEEKTALIKKIAELVGVEIDIK